jgi:hypothetical protein
MIANRVFVLTVNNIYVSATFSIVPTSSNKWPAFGTLIFRIHMMVLPPTKIKRQPVVAVVAFILVPVHSNC